MVELRSITASIFSTPKSHFASKISKSLFIIVALSMVILRPIAQVGCFRADFAFCFGISFRGKLRNAPPLAVISNFLMREAKFCGFVESRVDSNADSAKMRRLVI